MTVLCFSETYWIYFQSEQICDSLGCFDPSEILCYTLFSCSQEVCALCNSKMFSLRLIRGSNKISDADSNQQTLSLSNQPTTINFGVGLFLFFEILVVFTGLTCTAENSGCVCWPGYESCGRNHRLCAPEGIMFCVCLCDFLPSASFCSEHRCFPHSQCGHL